MIKKIWTIIALFFAVTNLISFLDNINPTLIVWQEFITYVVELYRNLRNNFFSWIPIEIKEIYKDYFLFGVIFSSVYSAGFARAIEVKIYHVASIVMYLVTFFAWPLMLLMTIIYSPVALGHTDEELMENPKWAEVVAVRKTIFGLRNLLIIFTILILINYSARLF